mmetsp:Transcript_12581/g.44046  ORF Transcript_12581/g.44046 Transcript_12581/m.44046 type:complete len:224 (+) Transcript_12581:922-1593(+)
MIDRGTDGESSRRPCDASHDDASSVSSQSMMMMVSRARARTISGDVCVSMLPTGRDTFTSRSSLPLPAPLARPLPPAPPRIIDPDATVPLLYGPPVPAPPPRPRPPNTPARAGDDDDADLAPALDKPAKPRDAASCSAPAGGSPCGAKSSEAGSPDTADNNTTAEADMALGGRREAATTTGGGGGAERTVDASTPRVGVLSVDTQQRAPCSPRGRARPLPRNR